MGKGNGEGENPPPQTPKEEKETREKVLDQIVWCGRCKRNVRKPHSC